jgi:hypothetical protein
VSFPVLQLGLREGEPLAVTQEVLIEEGGQWKTLKNRDDSDNIVMCHKSCIIQSKWNHVFWCVRTRSLGVVPCGGLVLMHGVRGPACRFEIRHLTLARRTKIRVSVHSTAPIPHKGVNERDKLKFRRHLYWQFDLNFNVTGAPHCRWRFLH